jgi:PAS domain S-box-containing protein
MVPSWDAADGVRVGDVVGLRRGLRDTVALSRDHPEMTRGVSVSEQFTPKPDVAALAIAEQRYRALVRATSSLVWTTSPDGQIVDMPEWRAYTGESIEQIKGWGWLNSLHPDDRERTETVWQHAVDMRSYYETEYRIRRSDGVFVWHRARGVPVLEPDGSIREWVGLCLNIEQRKRDEEKRIEAETALRRLNEVLEQRVESEARERARIWNVSQDMLLVADLEGKVLSLNPAWTTTLGWSEADLIGHTHGWLVHPDDRNKAGAELARLAEGTSTHQFENRLRHKDGSFRWLSWTTVSDRDRVYGVARDVTVIKATEEDLRSSRRELARAGRQLTMAAITASIAHEVNQPLGAIVNTANAGLRWLSSDNPHPEEATAAFKEIVMDARHASQVVEAVRAMFKKDTEEMTLLDINNLVRQVFVLLRSELQKNNIIATYELSDRLPRVLGQQVQLQQVVLNLVMNAIEAMSSVTDRPRRLRVNSEQCDPTGVILTLEDSGTGIDPKAADHIFEPFVTTKSNGMGMGLSICRSILAAHGGKVTVSAGTRHGAAFHVHLPEMHDPANLGPADSFDGRLVALDAHTGKQITRT